MYLNRKQLSDGTKIYKIINVDTSCAIISLDI